MLSQSSLVPSYFDLRMPNWTKLERCQLYHLPTRTKLECRLKVMRMPTRIKLEWCFMYQLLWRKTMGQLSKSLCMPTRKLERLLLYFMRHRSTMEPSHFIMLMPSQHFLERFELQNLRQRKQILELHIERLRLQNRKLERIHLHCLSIQYQLERKGMCYL